MNVKVSKASLSIAPRTSQDLLFVKTAI